MNEQLTSAIDRIEKYEPHDLKREGRDYEFTDVYPLIKTTYESITELKKHPDFVETLPEHYRNDLISTIERFASIVEQISNFSPQANPNPQEIRDSYSDEVKNVYSILFDRLITPLKTYSFEERTSKKNIAELSKKAEEELSFIRSMRVQVDKILESSRKASSTIGISAYSTVFEEQADEHKKMARRWLIASIVMLIALLSISIYMFSQTLSMLGNENLEPLNLFALSVAKLVFLSILYYSFYQIVKNFNINKHLYTINRHRSNVLKTFESFMSSTDDSKIRDTVLIKACDSIFSVGDTGYFANKESAKDGLELVNIMNPLQK